MRGESTFPSFLRVIRTRNRTLGRSASTSTGSRHVQWLAHFRIAPALRAILKLAARSQLVGSFLFSCVRCPVRIVSIYLAQTWRQRTRSKAPFRNRDRANPFRSRGQHPTTLFPHFEE